MKEIRIEKSKLIGVRSSNIVFFAFFSLAAYLYTFLIKSDILVSLKTGELILKNGSIIKQDYFSFMMKGKEWINFNWLLDMLYYVVYNHFGFSGIVIISSLFIGVTFVLIFKVMLKNYSSAMFFFFIFMTGSYIVLKNMEFRSMLNLMFITLYLVALDKFISENKNFIFFLPIIQIIWVNTSLEFVYGPVILILFYVGLIFSNVKLSSTKFKNKRILMVLLLVVIVNLINPYGYKIFTELYDLFINNKIQYINGWSSPKFRYEMRIENFFFLFLILLFLIGKKTSKNDKYQYLIPILFFQFVFFFGERNVVFYVLVIMNYLHQIVHFENLYSRNKIINSFLMKDREVLTQIKNIESKKSFNYLFMIFIIFIIVFTREDIEKKIINAYEKWFVDINACRFIEQSGISTNGFADRSSGDYFIWKGTFKNGVFTDNRMLLYKENLKYENDISKMRGNIFNTLEKFDIKWLLVSKHSQIYNVLADSGKWIKLYESDASIILIKVGVSLN